uniref:C-type lectin domain-containing protein n=1 Tax=Ficedula albicollis TaxID=59894 RepID=A0A803V6Z6_FICAL
ARSFFCHIPSPAAGFGFQGSQRVPAASPRCPRRLLEALTAALALSLVLCSEFGVGKGLRAPLPTPPLISLTGFPAVPQRCLSAPGSVRVPAEREGCRLCAVGWRLIGNKCYWISDSMNPWSKSRQDCGNRGSTLLVPWDQDELVKEMMALGKPTRHYWIGLSVPVAGMATWGALGGNGIVSQSCDTRLQWICEKESAEI